MSERAQRIQDTMHTPGWHDIAAMLNEQAQEMQDALLVIMADRPDSLTDKTSLKYAIRLKALRDFYESLQDEVKKVNQPQPTRAG